MRGQRECLMCGGTSPAPSRGWGIHFRAHLRHISSKQGCIRRREGGGEGSRTQAFAYQKTKNSQINISFCELHFFLL